MATTFPSSSTLFAFNRYAVKIDEGTPGTRYTLGVGLPEGQEGYEDAQQVGQNGNLEMVFNHYLQLLFSKEDIIAGKVSLEALVSFGSTARTARTYTVYWGAISAGERLGDRTLRYYPSLDNPLPTWLIEGTYNLIQSDNDEAVEAGTVLNTSIYDMRNYFNYQGVEVKHELVLMQMLTDKNVSTFDETFDYTFWAFGKGDVLRTKVIVDCATSGVYLKWIDPQGCWYYWLFEPYTKTYKTKAIGDDYETFTEGENVGYYGALRPRGYTQENTQAIVASMASREERRVLETILASPLVFWCPDVEKIASGDLTNDTAEWLPVRIVAGSTKDDLSDLADFEIDVQYPNKNVQIL